MVGDVDVVISVAVESCVIVKSAEKDLTWVTVLAVEVVAV